VRAAFRWIAATTIVVLASACEPASTTGSGGFVNSPAGPTTSPVTVETSAASPTPPALPDDPPPTRGAPSDTCIEGWTTPEPGTKDATTPIRWIRQVTPFRGEAVVVDMRLFTGDESPYSDKNYLENIRRWYVKLFAADDLTYQGRFLVEERRFGTGVVAVAPYDTSGFTSPDWIGFQFEEGAEPQAYEGLPGRWDGIAYDFVKGGGGLTIPGLPANLVGCLDGT
jgi:hypothetical protein